MATEPATASGVRWELADLCADAAAATGEWEALLGRARVLAERHRGRVASLDASGLRGLLDELDGIEEDQCRVQFYAVAREHTEAASEEANDLGTQARDRAAELENLLLFAELEWLALDDDRAEELLAAPELAPFAHKLREARRLRPYVLGEPEEQALNTRRPVVAAWETLHGRQLATLVIPFDAGDGEEPHTIDRLLAYVHEPRRELRLASVEALYDGLEPRADVLAAAYDAIVGDRLSVDRLRSVPEPMLPTHLRNELDGEVVEAMMTAVEDHHPLARRWFVRKAELLGLDRLELADQYAPVGSSRRVGWDEAVRLVDGTLAGFAPRLAEIYRACLERGHVDAEPRPGKVGGAYCNSVSRHVLPYVLLNFTGNARDVVTVAHEFGHATHGVLALERQAFRSWRVGLALAEVPSTFAQLLAIERLLEREEDEPTRAAILSGRVESALGAIFRQTVLARFEQRAYALRGEGRALTAERLSQIWLEENERYYADALALPDGYRLGWSYIPHFIGVRFYTYAYSFAYLVALSLLGRYGADPEAFVPAYLDLLAAGGSASPQGLLAPLGVDLRDPGTWTAAFEELERQLGTALTQGSSL